MSFHVPNKFRIRSGRIGSDDSIGNAGAFEIKLKHSQTVFVIASDAMGWEHVSVSRKDRCPTWDEMCQIKALFWGEDDCIVQYHPPKRAYVNNHPYCLHLWRPTDFCMPMPPSIMVGLKEAA
jgi:hypothetical protein